MERSNVWGDGLNTNNENTNCAQEQEISKFFNFEDTSYKAAICRLVSIDNIPLSLLAKSNDLKKLLKYRFNESHQSPNSIRKILFEYKFKVLYGDNQTVNDQQTQNFIKTAYEDQKILQEAYSQIDIEINDEFVDKIEINQSNLESDSSELNDDEAGFPIEADQTYLDFTSTSDKNLISKIRKAIAQINKSSFNKEIFSNLTEESSELEFKRLNIHSDVVTRWDSLFTMLKDFDKMHNCIECALMKIYSNERSSKKRSSIEILTFEEPELCRIKELIQILDPIHNAIAELSKKDTNLFVAELSIELMLDILLMIKQSSSSLKIYNELEQNLNQLEKRRTILSDIAIVLYDPKSAIYK
ncbi:V-type proton ATPase 21 kDa proteolipid subunit [Blomia tropicalis]|nr:V-type proton ATPase 21 kDa proteolipid subunit [Blomia tropicalis]